MTDMVLFLSLSKMPVVLDEIKISVGTVLIFQFNPGFGTEASVTAVPQYRFWYLSSGSYFSIPKFPMLSGDDMHCSHLGRPTGWVPFFGSI